MKSNEGLCRFFPHRNITMFGILINSLIISLTSTLAIGVTFVEDNRYFLDQYEVWGTPITSDLYTPDSPFADFSASVVENDFWVYGQESSFSESGFSATGVSSISLGDESYFNTSVFDITLSVTQGTILDLSGSIHTNSASYGDYFSITTLSIYDDSGLFYSVSADAVDGDGDATTVFAENLILDEGSYRIVTDFSIYSIGGPYPSATADYTFDANFITTPIPAAIWLFGSGLIGLVGVARRKVHA